MKNLYLILITVLSLQFKAQHTLTAAFNPIAGDVESYTYIDTTGLFLGSSGTGQTWNYTAITTTWSPQSYTYVPMSSVPNNFMFPGASIARDDGFGGYTVYSNNATKNEEMGYATATASDCVLYSNALKYYSLPFMYGSSSPDVYNINAATYTVTGNVVTTGDGTGTLQLPSGTYNNILKLKFDVIQSVSSGTYAASYTVTECRYYSALSKFPLLTIGFQTYTSTSGSGSDKYGMINTFFITGINGHENNLSLGVFPNPVTNGEFMIRDTKAEITSVVINNALGQTVKTVYFENPNGMENKKIDVSELTKGIYYLQVNGKEGIRTKKILIE